MNTHLYANGVPITLPDGTEFPFWQDETEYRRSQPAGVIGPVPSKRLASDRVAQAHQIPTHEWRARLKAKLQREPH